MSTRMGGCFRALRPGSSPSAIISYASSHGDFVREMREGAFHSSFRHIQSYSVQPRAQGIQANLYCALRSGHLIPRRNAEAVLCIRRIA